MPRNKRSVLATLAWLILVGTLGYLGNRTGHILARAGYFRGAVDTPQTHEMAARRDGSSGRPQRTKTSATPKRAGVVDAALETLRRIQRDSTGIEGDWEAKAAIQRVMADLSPADLGELYGRMDARDGSGWPNDLSLLVGARWAAEDPDAAIHAAVVRSKWRGGYFAMGIFREWSAEHPQEALAWLDTAELDPALAERRDEMRGIIVDRLAERDFSLAKKELAKLGEKAAREVMQRWGGNHVVDAAMREKLIEYAKFTGKPTDFSALNEGLVRAWPENDPLGLMNHLEDLQEYLESDALPVAARPETDAAAVGIAIHREYQEAAMEWWMGRYSQSSVTPAPLREAMAYWTRQKPEMAAQWLAEQPDSPQRDSLSAAAAPAFMQKGDFPTAAEIIASISDPAIRQAGIERLEILWEEKDPVSAKAWKDARDE